MTITMSHSDIGTGTLDTETMLFTANGRGYKCSDEPGYLHRMPGVAYTASEEVWVNDYIIGTNLVDRYDGRTPLFWAFGASWKTAEQLTEIERRLGKRVPLA